jgi:hypothetical protein
MTETGSGHGQGDPQLPRDGYTRPQLFLEQEDFEETQEPLSEDDRTYVLSGFERTVDTLRDNAESRGKLETDYPEPGREADRFWTTGDDDRQVSVTILKDAASGTVIRRSLTIYWDEDMVGSSTYEASYVGKTLPTVTRDDDSGRLPLGTTQTQEGFRQKLQAEEAQAAHGFNRRAVRGGEISGLQRYMHVPPQDGR